jgi:phosphoglycerol transferase MdoB-like AlkP superfamily enzyme
MIIRKTAFRNLAYFFSVYILLILLFALFRLLLVIIEFDFVKAIPGYVQLILKAFLIGWRFDTVIVCYILALPAFVLSLFSFFRIRSAFYYNVMNAFFLFLCIGSFFIAAIDLPWFAHFSSRLTSAVLAWKDSPAFVLRMILQEPKFYLYFFVFLLFSGAFIFLHSKIRNTFFNPGNLFPDEGRRFPFDLVMVSIILLGLLFLGARGRIAKKSPLKSSAAFFSDYPLVNQVALNPDYTFMVSMLDDQKEENNALHLVDNASAIKEMMRGFNIGRLLPGSPVAREVRAQAQELKANVVVVIMESMAIKRMRIDGNNDNLTPTLDSLAGHSLFFTHVYSSGMHTSAGVYATLFSFPNLLHHHPLNYVIIPEYTGLGQTLREKGFQTIYFTTHDDMFDNIGGFLRSNGYERIVCQKDYPEWQVRSTLGVPDHYMFDFSIPILTNLYNNKKPFLSVFLTASLHDPYIVPSEAPGFKPHSTTIEKQIVEYADWSIHNFLTLAAQQPWFDNTIFVFIADHGGIVKGSPYDLSLEYFHIPLIFYSPALIRSQVCEKTGAQLDLFPTLMGLLNQNYTNNTLGIDLLRESRPFAFFCSDDAIGCVNQEYFLVSRKNGVEDLYHFNNEETRNYIDEKSALADSMRTYAFSMLQGAQWMVKNNKTMYGRESGKNLHPEK